MAEKRYLVHEHSDYTSAIDKYWIFTDEAKARKFYKEIVNGYGIDMLDVERELEVYNCEDPDATELPENYLLELLEDPPETVLFKDDVYIVFTEIDAEGFGRRP